MILTLKSEINLVLNVFYSPILCFSKSILYLKVMFESLSMNFFLC